MGKAGTPDAKETKEQNLFRFGNGHQEVSDVVVEMPIELAGRKGIVRAAVIEGQAPLLLSRAALKKLKASMDFHHDELRLFDDNVRVPLRVNEAGQYIVSVLGEKDQKPASPESAVVVTTDQEPASPESAMDVTTDQEAFSVDHPDSRSSSESDLWEVRGSQVVRIHRVPRRSPYSPDDSCPVPVSQLEDQRCTTRCYEGIDKTSPEVVVDQWRDATTVAESSCPWTGTTVFQVALPPEPPASSTEQHDEVAACQWSRRQFHKLKESLKGIDNPPSRSSKNAVGSYDIVEVFSPPRFAPVAATKGLSCLSADLLTGWDFRRPAERQSMCSIAREQKPKLLVLCPPCTWAGGWCHLNKFYMSPEERREKDRLTKLFANFCAELAQIQLEQGGRVLFEHPAGSSIWKLPKLEALCHKMHEVRLDMCAFGMCIPDGLPILKHTRLLVSHANMRSLGRQCPGKEQHPRHQQVAGNHPKVGSVSRFASQYPKGFVRAVLRTVPALPSNSVLLVQTGTDRECLAAAAVRELNAQRREQMLQTLHRLHVNLGHPSSSNLARVLKHGGASQAAIDLCRELQCDVCRAQKPPTPPPPAQTNRAERFNQRIGLDVKYLPGWKPNQRIPALNIVDYASSYQVMIPLPGRETGASLRQALQERWIVWAGVPEEIVVDPAQTNLSDALTVPQELAGAMVSSTAAEAHWQLGKVEVHGGWFSRVLEKVIADAMPHDRDSWMECVCAAHSKNELIQVHGPSAVRLWEKSKDSQSLLDEPLQVVPATASLYEESLARRIAVRQAARKAVIELQDDKALRLSLQARPRKVQAYSPGDKVAYWRTQKSHEGVIEQGGRWYGPAIVLGYVGRNLVVVHKKQILRCAPEQVRPSTSEEAVLTDTPGLELLGIKQMLQSGSLQSRQYEDLIPQGFPPVQEPSPLMPK